MSAETYYVYVNGDPNVSSRPPKSNRFADKDVAIKFARSMFCNMGDVNGVIVTDDNNNVLWSMGDDFSIEGAISDAMEYNVGE